MINEDFKQYIDYIKYHRPACFFWKLSYIRQMLDLTYEVRRSLRN